MGQLFRKVLEFYAALPVRQCLCCCSKPATREAVLRHVTWEAVCDECLEKMPVIERANYEDPDGRVIEDWGKCAREALAELNSSEEDGWISVLKELPEIADPIAGYSKDVLVYLSSGVQCIGFYRLDGGWCLYDEDADEAEITHWRSLLKGPKSSQGTTQ